MDYKTACETEVSAVQAQRVSFAEFQAECGIKQTYRGQDVLNWLGY